MFKKILFCCLLITAAACSAPEPASTPTPPDPILEIISRFENNLVPISADGANVDFTHPRPLAERMLVYNVPGLSIALIHDFDIEWARSYGVLEANGADLVTDDTLFHAGSIAKPVSAAAALALVEDGTLSLDENVNERLTSWQVPENEFTTETGVTLRSLLSHSSGLTDGLPMRSNRDPEWNWWTTGEGQSPSVTILQLLEAQPPVEGSPTRVTHTPGTVYQYANLGYGVLELLINDTTRQPFSKFMQDTVLSPLNLSRSTFSQPLPENFRSNAVTEHYFDGTPYPDKRHHFPVLAAGGLWTTPSDLARFAIDLMLAYNGERGRLLSPEMAREMLSPQIEIPDNPFADAAGLGFMLGDAQGTPIVFHTGGTWGSTSLLWFFPESGDGVVIMTNTAGGDGAIRFEILLGLAQIYGWPLLP